MKYAQTILATLLAAVFAPPGIHSQQPPPGTVLWIANLGSQITSSPAIGQDGTIYFGTQVGLSAVTNAGVSGSNKWTFLTAASVKSSPAVGADGTIYFGSDDSKFYAVSPYGTQKWAYTFQTRVPSSPAIDADGTICVAADGSLNALTPMGIKKWAYPMFNEQCSPIIGPDRTIYIGNGLGNSLFAVKPDGNLRWSFHMNDGSVSAGNSAAVAADGNIYETGGFLYAFSADGSNLWSTPSPYNRASPVVDKAGMIYAESALLSLYSLKPSGETNWSVPYQGAYPPPPPTSPALDADGNIYYCVANGIYALSSQGQDLWNISGGDPGPGINLAITSPVIASDGTIYAALGSSLYAIAGTNSLADSSWPMYRQNPRHTGRIEKPALIKSQKHADASFEFQIYDELGKTNTIQTSLDLTTWTSLTNIFITNVPMDFIDWDATNFPSRFYRAVQQ